MPLDSVFLGALTEELRGQLTGAAVTKVNMPSRDTVLLQLRGKGKDLRLLCCAGTGSARLQLTEERPENLPVPPMFCMLLRKHLTGAKVTGLQQPEFERVVRVRFDAFNALGDPEEKELIAECMGRYSNLILTDGEGIVIDCLRRIGAEDSDKRLVLPGLRYRLPPAPDRFRPTETDALTETLAKSEPSQNAAKELGRLLCGLSPLLVRETVCRVCGSTDASVAELTADGGERLRLELERLCAVSRGVGAEPVLLWEDRTAADFSCVPICQYGTARRTEKMESFCALLDAYYARRDRAERMRQRSHALVLAARTARDRTARRIANQCAELQAASDREEKRICGELITANLWRMQKGQRLLETEDWYAEGTPLRRIELDPLKTPQQNAAAYFKEYQKAKTACAVLTERISAGREELEWLESVLEELGRAENEKTLEEIRQELLQAGCVRLKKGEKQRPVRSEPITCRTADGLEVRVGRNNLQNDRLTLKESAKTDLWLHAKRYPGAHVLVRLNGAAPDERTVLEAAALAAGYSGGADAGTVEVDYTLVKYVKKPAGAKPGRVIYTNYRTVSVKPAVTDPRNR